MISEFENKSRFKQLAVLLLAKKVVSDYRKCIAEPEYFFKERVNRLVTDTKKYKKDVVDECIRILSKE
jgi:hypothetical protein